MRSHGYNGEFSYEPEYSCTDEDLAGVSQVFTGVQAITPVIDIQHGEDRAVLVSVQQLRSDDKVCLIYNQADGTKHFYKPDSDIPKSSSELADSMKDWTVGKDTKKRSRLWGEVHRLSNRGEEIADHTIEANPMLSVVDEEELENGMVEMEIEYDERLVQLVSDYYSISVEDVGKQLISDFITVTLYKEVSKTDV